MRIEDLVVEIALAIPLECPRCQTVFRWDRIEVRGHAPGQGYHLLGLCGPCNGGFPIFVDIYHRKVENARLAVLGDRSLEEELKLREADEVIPQNYEERLPFVLVDFWRNEPKSEGIPPIDTI